MAWLMRLTLIAPLVFGFGCGDGGGKEKKSGKAGGESAAAMKSEPAAAKPTDIIDRIFSPLDNAVSDINQDLNKGDADTPSGPNE